MPNHDSSRSEVYPPPAESRRGIFPFHLESCKDAATTAVTTVGTIVRPADAAPMAPARAWGRTTSSRSPSASARPRHAARAFWSRWSALRTGDAPSTAANAADTGTSRAAVWRKRLSGGQQGSGTRDHHHTSSLGHRRLQQVDDAGVWCRVDKAIRALSPRSSST